MNADLAQSTEGTVLVGGTLHRCRNSFFFGFWKQFCDAFFGSALHAGTVKEASTTFDLWGANVSDVSDVSDVSVLWPFQHNTCQFGAARGVPESRE